MNLLSCIPKMDITTHDYEKLQNIEIRVGGNPPSQPSATLLTKQALWKQRTNFEQSDRRRGYRAGYNARKRGKTELPDDLPDNGWGAGYRQGFKAASQ